MIIYDVYTIRDNFNNVLYVGQTTNHHNRFRAHISKSGLFYKRTNVRLQKEVRFLDYEKTLDFENELQKYFNVSIDYPNREIKHSYIKEYLNMVKSGKKHQISNELIINELRNYPFFHRNR